ncbi:hypothetical protein LIER_21554 [Lithospermum erythrorhizon]|uniref:Filament-like plant protein 7 n=1 Tax=Lithospermum erythrorhizon TaxID=34254 RepID=A0AAV3QS77_LITER
MENKTWLWKRKPSEKTIVSNGEEDASPTENVEELAPSEKELALQETVDILNEKLASILEECSSKDELVADYSKKAEEALAGKERAELEVVRLKEELNEALRERVEENERTSKLNAALKDCMHQLNSLRQDQDRRLHEAVDTTSRELEKSHHRLEERLKMMNKMLSNLTAENSHLSEELIEKEMMVEDLSKCRKQAEAEFETLMARQDIVEKENAFLRYEFRMLEKELDIRNEEMKVSRYSLEASNKQCMENLRKMKKLEAECQRLRILVRKRLPGPAALVKMSRDIELYSGNQIQTRMTNMKPIAGGSVVRDSAIGTPPSSQGKKIQLLMENLRDVEEQNKILREILIHKDAPIKHSDTSVSSPSDIDSQVTGHNKFQETILSPNVSYNICKDNRTLSSPSSTSSSCWEFEKFKTKDSKNASDPKVLGISDMSLMDDFAEMEKLAIVTVDAPLDSSTHNTPNSSKLLNASNETCRDGTPTCKELVLVEQTDTHALPAPSDWLQHVIDIILEQHHVSGRSLDVLVEDMMMALKKNSPGSGEACQTLNSIDRRPISGFLLWRSPVTSPKLSSPGRSVKDENLCEKPRNSIMESNLGRSIRKVIELVRGLHPDYPNEPVSSFEESEKERSITCCHQPSTAADYIVHVFRWKRCELFASIQQFLDTCGKLLEGEVDFEKFAEELASGLSLILNNHSENDKRPELGDEQQAELETLRESKRMAEDQIENLKSINEDLDTQLTVSNANVNEVLQKLSSFEVELEDKNHRCEELEGTCLELQLLLESITNKETPEDNADEKGNLLPNGWEISAASVKLEQCQDTIIELGKQLKALASSKETTVTAKHLTASTPNTDHKMNRRLSLLDRMQHDDTPEGQTILMPSAMEITSNTKQNHPPLLQPYVPIESPSIGALAIVPVKKKRGTASFLKKLLMRRKNGSSRKPFLSLHS